MNGCLILCAAVAAATALASGAPALAYEPANQTNEMEGYSSHPTLTAEEAAAQAKELAAFDEFVASDIDDWEMPQIVNLTPWWWNGSGGYWVWLHDWSGHQSTTGHYIVGNGYRGGWDTSADDDFRFDDGAEGFGGGTGTWWDSLTTSGA